MKYTFQCICLLCLLINPFEISAQNCTPVECVAFPGAVGYGRLAGVDQAEKSVFFVTNLNDAGAGSLRDALSQGNRYIIFNVAGTITLSSSIDVQSSNIYIAGQTAFSHNGEGITIRSNGNFGGGLLRFHNDHIILRYLRLRRGPGVSNEVGGDNVSFFGDHWIMDHCSISWGTDENMEAGGNSYGTVQYSLSSEGLYFSTHRYTTDSSHGTYQTGHSKGGIFGWGGSPAKYVSFYRNLFAHNDGRNPRIASPGSTHEVVNNLMYNNRYFNIEVNQLDGTMQTNIVKNLLIPGSDTRTVRYMVDAVDSPDNKIYMQGNIGVHRTNDSQPEWGEVGRYEDSSNQIGQSNSAFSSPLQPRFSSLPNALDLEQLVLADVGANLKSDLVDQRIINDVINRTPTVRKFIQGTDPNEWSGSSSYYGIINDPSEVGGWPTIGSMTGVPVDSDNDGMPNQWEILNNLNPNHPADALATHGSGYPNIEVYLSELVNPNQVESVSLTNWPDTIEIGASYDLTVDYVVNENSIIYAQVFDRENTDTGNWNKIGETWAQVSPGSGSVSLNNLLINLDVGSSNRLEILLYHPIVGGSWGSPLPIGDVSVNVPGRSNILFGEADASDPSTYMRYYNRDLECNGSTYNGGYAGNGSGFDHTLAPTTSLYRSNWWVNANWKGPIKSHYGEDDENGKNFWVEWQNLGKCSDGHAEFDIRVEKSNRSDNAVGAGFVSRLGDITEPLDCTFTGRWTAGSLGRGHINMTAWVYNTLNLNPDGNATRCDIIVHAFDNSGDFRKRYEIGFRWSLPGTNIIFHFDKIGTATSNGISYDVLRTMPGGFGEGASYNLIPTAWPREFMEEFPTSTINSRIDMNSIFKDIIELEAANGSEVVSNQDGTTYTPQLVTEDWGLHVMEWTITGQSGEYEHDPAYPDDFSKKVYIPNSMGRFTFEEYHIPNPCCSNPNKVCDPILECLDPADCETDIVQTGNQIITNSEFAKNSIISDGLIMTGSNIEFTAGANIQLMESFEVQSGAVFHAYVQSCGN